jgi:hypothetical protein
MDFGGSVQIECNRGFKPRGYSEMEVRNGCRDLPGAASLRVFPLQHPASSLELPEAAVASVLAPAFRTIWLQRKFL